MKLRIVKKFYADKDHNVCVFDGYELQEKLFFFSPWKTLKNYRLEKEIEHDIVWLFELAGKIRRTTKYDNK